MNKSITSYFTLSADNVNKRLKLDEKLLKEFEDKPKDSSDEKDDKTIASQAPRKKVNPSTFLKWQKQFPWLQMTDNELMICGICKDFAKQEDSSFVNGCPASRLETVSISFFLNIIYTFV